MSDDKKHPDQEEKSNEDKHDNVIRFPVERVKSKRRLKKLAGKVNDNRKTTLFLSLFSVMVLAAYLLQTVGGEADRNIANTDFRDQGKERVLAQRLQANENRAPASFGRKPAAEDVFRRQFLHYEIQHEEGFFWSMELPERSLQGANKVYLNDLNDGDLMAFLMSYRDYIYPGFNEVAHDPDPDLELNQQSFLLFRDGESLPYKVRFEFKRDDELSSIKVQAIRKP